MYHYFFIHQYLFYGHCTIYNNFLPVNSVLGSSQTPKETFNAASYRRDKAKILERQKAFKLTTTIVAALLLSYSPLIVLRII